MIKKKRYLITTEDEKTWKFDQPVIFLGEWCRLYNRKHIWQNMDAIVAKPYGLDFVDKDADNSMIIKLEKSISSELYELFNQHFNTNYSNRFWKIFIGPWFRATLKILLNRINTIKKCLQTEEITGITLYNSDYCSLVPPDLKSAYNYFFDDSKWNNILNGRILNLLDYKKISVNFLEEKNNQYFETIMLEKNLSLKSQFKNKLYKSYKKFSKFFVKNDDAFLISTYFTTKQTIKLELGLKQWPQIWRKSEFNINLQTNELLRKNLSKKFIKKSQNDVENILRRLLFELLPVCYLEGFKDLEKIVKNEPWPKSPKFIFTSNNFGTDEIFKLYTAIKTENGTKYYVGQHGNNYFTSKLDFPRIEEQTSDKFFTWGWKNLPKYVPTFIFKTVGNLNHYNSKGGLLLIEQSQKRDETWDIYAEFLAYFKDQKKFVSLLSKEPRQKLIIRLSSSKSNIKYYENSRWIDFDKSLKINNGIVPIKDLVSESRLIVHSYDSTGMLETLSQNIPTLAFWQNNFDHLREKVIPEYQLLVDAGIVHLSAQSVANKVNEIWDDVDGWWFQKNVQDAKEKFCDIYAKNCKNPINTMVSHLVKNQDYKNKIKICNL